MFHREGHTNFAVMKEARIAAETTIDRLYPEEKFPRKWFPDLQQILANICLEAIKHRKDLQEGDHGRERLAQSAEAVLDLKNLLENHPQTVVLLYRRYIERYIFYKHRKIDEREDIFQEVITRLMEDKIFKIRDHFDFDSKKYFSFTSYLMVTVRNIYIDIIRERSIRPLTAGDVQPVDELFDKRESERMINRLVIEEELLRLQTIMKMFYKSRPKLELCLKLKYRIPVSSEETHRCFPACSQEDVETLSQDFITVNDKTMFETIIAVFNLHEARQYKSDTLRKWTFVKIDEIVTLLNRAHGRDVYSRESVGELITLYYQAPGRGISGNSPIKYI